MPELSYIISSDFTQFAAHPVFTINTIPILHSLCGEVEYSATFDGTEVDGDPLDYDPVTRKFTADSEDRSLIGLTKPYAVIATFANWPPSTYTSAPSVTGSSTIEFVDPCLNPFTFQSTAQTAPAPDKYTGNAITFTLNPFTITPDYCEVSYACDSITFEDQPTSSISCNDLTLDGLLFGQTGAGGSLTYLIGSTEYLSGNYPPGTYTVTVIGTGVNSNPS